jgi:hypothetical protein
VDAVLFRNREARSELLGRSLGRQGIPASKDRKDHSRKKKNAKITKKLTWQTMAKRQMQSKQEGGNKNLLPGINGECMNSLWERVKVQCAPLES